MTERAIFGRRYSSYQPAGTEVYLLNGTAVSLTAPTTQTFTAGANLLQGSVVYVSGVYALPALAASGVSQAQYSAIGITTETATTSGPVPVVFDDIVVVSAANITAESALVPGEYYYLSKYSSELTRYSTASGLVTAASGFAALVSLGQALSTTELQVEIEAPVTLTN
jgi:predicted RecA/RadA family phage recombinase